jgi:P-type conjugative transfer protein TrbJ
MSIWHKTLAASLLSGILVLGSLTFLTARAADAVYCVNCGTEVTQLASKLQQAQQVATAIKQLQNQISQYANMVTNTNGLSSQVWGNAMRDIGRLNSLIQQSKALAHTASNLDGQFANRYGTYQSYLGQRMNGTDWTRKYAQWSQEASDNSLYTLKALGLQAQQMNDEDATMRQLEAMAGSAQGRMQALQVANMMAAQGVRQTQKLRQLVMMQLQMQADYLAAQQDKEAARAAARQQFFKPAIISNTNGQRY